MSPLPGIVSHTRAGRRVRMTEHPKVVGPDVAVKSNQTDAGNTRTSLLRPAYMLVKVAATGLYVAADDSTGDRCAAASVASLVTNPGAGGWDGTLTISGHWGSLSVTLSGDNTDAAVAAAIIAAAAAVNPEQGPITAADTTGEVTVTNREKGAGTWLKVVHTTVTTAFGASGTAGVGTDADYVVSEDYCDLLDGNAVAITGCVRTTRAAHYDAANLLHATAEGLTVLARRGSIIDGTPTLVG